VYERNPYRPVACSARALQRALYFIEIRLLKPRLTHQRRCRFHARLSAPTTRDLDWRSACRAD
jgi:hypothetical protein